ncbi:FlxA-like family protein [Desulfonatronum lacustre]|uniref:FlxA-like family protein n=1 Tax=Desulfonatronum lacustre TaxID=66849 RepID=UPI00048B2457|nr:FlxA-like family protein [Desulfonatronum lacustre]
MRIDGYQNFLRTGESAGQPIVRETQATDWFRGASTSAGGDTVSISPAAREAQQAAKSEDTGDNDAAEAFRKYMHKARGGIDSSSSGPLEALQARLKDLTNKLSAIAANQSMPEQTKNSMIQVIQAEINQISAQIAELEAQASETA